MKLKPGLYPNISFGSYQEIDALNWSTLRNMLKSPAECKRFMDNPPEPSDSQEFGTATHTYLLERDTFNDRVAVFTGARRAGKEWESFKAANGSKLIITASQMETIEKYGSRWQSHPLTKDLLSDAETEVTLVWECGDRLLKARIDLLAPGIIYDVKTTRHPDPASFSEDVRKYNYAHQLAFYAMGHQAVFGDKTFDVGFIACPTVQTAVDNLLIFRHPGVGMEWLKKEITGLIHKYTECEKSGLWPEKQGGYYDLFTGAEISL